MDKINKWIVLELTWAGVVRICGYNLRENFFDTKAGAQELYNLVNNARGDQSKFEVVKIEIKTFL